MNWRHIAHFLAIVHTRQNAHYAYSSNTHFSTLTSSSSSPSPSPSFYSSFFVLKFHFRISVTGNVHSTSLEDGFCWSVLNSDVEQQNGKAFINDHDGLLGEGFENIEGVWTVLSSSLFGGTSKDMAFALVGRTRGKANKQQPSLHFFLQEAFCCNYGFCLHCVPIFSLWSSFF